MTGITALWLPILLSAIAVFVASSLIHMVSPWHKGDYPKVPDEEAVRSALGPLAIPPGDYMVPRPVGRAEMRSPEFLDKVRAGPNLILTVLPNGPYIAGRALSPDPEGAGIVRFVGATAFIGYSAALWQMSIWYRRAWSTTVKATVDGLIYALITAAIFCFLWPR